jgi:hypothetical protein
MIRFDESNALSFVRKEELVHIAPQRAAGS